MFDSANPTLEGLAFLLRHQELWPAGFKWDYRDHDTCAMGLVGMVTKAPYGALVCREMAKLFQIPEAVSVQLFLHFPMPVMHDVTPEHIANAIDNYLSTVDNDFTLGEART